MTPVMQNGLVYMGDGKILKPSGEECFYEMYGLTFPTEETAETVIVMIQTVIAGEGWDAEPKFAYTGDGIRWIVEVEKDPGNVVVLDIGQLAQKANTQEDPHRAMAAAIKTQLGLI